MRLGQDKQRAKSLAVVVAAAEVATDAGAAGGRDACAVSNAAASQVLTGNA